MGRWVNRELRHALRGFALWLPTSCPLQGSFDQMALGLAAPSQAFVDSLAHSVYRPAHSAELKVKKLTLKQAKRKTQESYKVRLSKAK